MHPHIIHDLATIKEVIEYFTKFIKLENGYNLEKVDCLSNGDNIAIVLTVIKDGNQSIALIHTTWHEVITTYIFNYDFLKMSKITKLQYLCDERKSQVAITVHYTHKD